MYNSQTGINKGGVLQLADKTIDLYAEYNRVHSDYMKLCSEINIQLNLLLEQKGVKLAVPVEYRVKEWDSIVLKLERFNTDLKSISEINDLAGIRVIVLFKRDIQVVTQILEDTFTIHRIENIEDRLLDNQFGYTSTHFELSVPTEWCKLPTLKSIDGLKLELQLRTISQHTWATASHILQYKKELDVPPPVKRSINRVAALLETVDLEFERVLGERENYKETTKNETAEKENTPVLLNVDLLVNKLETEFPDRSSDKYSYSDILDMLLYFSINDLDSLDKLFIDFGELVKEEDKQRFEERKKDMQGRMPQRLIQRGGFFTHRGLIKRMLDKKFGPEVVDKYSQSNQPTKIIGTQKSE